MDGFFVGFLVALFAMTILELVFIASLVGLVYKLTNDVLPHQINRLSIAIGAQNVSMGEMTNTLCTLIDQNQKE